MISANVVLQAFLQISGAEKEKFLKDFRHQTALSMSCYVFQFGDPEPVHRRLRDDEIDVPVWDVISGVSEWDVIIVLSGHPHEGRMVNLSARLEEIAEFVRDYLKLRECSVRVGFQSILDDHVASA